MSRDIYTTFYINYMQFMIIEILYFSFLFHIFISFSYIFIIISYLTDD